MIISSDRTSGGDGDGDVNNLTSFVIRHEVTMSHWARSGDCKCFYTHNAVDMVQFHTDYRRYVLTQ